MAKTYVLTGNPGFFVHLFAYFTSGFPGDSTRHVLAAVDGNSTPPSPATPRKSPPGLSRSGLRTPPRTQNAERLTRNTSEPGAPSTPSIPSARGAEPDALPCADRGDGRAVNGAPAMRTPEVPGKRAAAGSGRGLRPSGGKSRSHRKRLKGRTVTMEGVPGLTGRLEDEEYRDQQRVAREEKVARREQEIADDQARKDEASRKMCPGRRRITGVQASPSASTLRADPRRRQSAPAALGGHQPRARKKQRGQASCGWTPSALGVICDACPGEVVHSTTVALCAACHRRLPDGKATHLGRERQQRARAFVQRRKADGVGMPTVVVRTFKPNGHCLCLEEDFFHAFFEASGDRQAGGSRQCATCNQQKKDGKWYKVGAEDRDGMTAGDTGGACSDAAHLPSFDCKACYNRKIRARDSEAAVNSASQDGVIERPRPSSMERVQEMVMATVADGSIVDWTEAREWLTQAREDDHQVGLKDDYDRLLVRRIFHEVAKTPGSNARVVSGKRGLGSGGDGREAHLLLFPKDVPDQLVVDLYLSGHGGTGSVGGVHLNSAEDKEQPLDNVLQAIVKEGRDEAGKMVIVRAAADLVRRDILTLETVQNVAGGRAKEAHVAELKRDITPVWDSLKENAADFGSTAPGPDRYPPLTRRRPRRKWWVCVGQRLVGGWRGR